MPFTYDNVMTMLLFIMTFFIIPGLILLAMYVITGVLIMIIVLLGVVICVMYNRREDAIM